MKLTKDFSYAHYTKVLSTKEMDKLTEITENAYIIRNNSNFYSKENGQI